MKSKVLKVSNYILYISMCLTLSAGLVLEYRLPSGPLNKGVQLLGLARHSWGQIHFYCAAIFIAASLLHLGLNWSWITKVATQSNRLILLLSLGLGLALILVPLLLPLAVKGG